MAGAAQRLADGETTAVTVTESVLEQATLTEADLHCFLTLDRTGALAAAEESDRRRAKGEARGRLDGIPVAIKDNMCTRGMETTAGSQILAGYRPPYDAHVVERLREQGAVLVGKTNLDEFAMGSSTESSAYGPTRNPWDAERVPGGSSGGSSAAVAAGSVLGAYGSDTGGSIRQPASLCGVVGVKPTYGRVSRYGLIAFASSLDQIGPLALTVEDAAILLEGIWGHDRRDATSLDSSCPDLSVALERGVEGTKVGIVTELGGDGYEPAVTEAMERVVKLLADAGAELEEVSIPAVDVALSAYYLINPAEASANLARFDGIRYGNRVAGATTEELMAKTRGEGFGPEVIRRVLLGTFALSAGYHDAFYGQAQRVRTLLAQQFAAVYARVDALVSPTSPTTAFELGAKTGDPLAMYLSDVCTIPSNLTGHPALSLPAGLDATGLPIGVQVMAPPLGEETMFAVAAEIERRVGFDSRPTLVAGVMS